jgi:hypothetical protein
MIRLTSSPIISINVGKRQGATIFESAASHALIRAEKRHEIDQS